jgi:hypothetical protein
MAAKKKASAKKTPKKKTSKKKAPTKKTAGKSGTPQAAEPASSSAEPAKSKASKEAVSSMSVNRAHVFGLRPRVSLTFRQPDFQTAKHLLQDESYKNISEAARAVVEKALELTRGGPPSRRERR